MDYHDFIYEYIFLFCYVYSILLIRITEYKRIGWWLLLSTHFASTAYFLSINIFRFQEPTFYILLVSFSLVLVSLFFIVSKLTKYTRPDPSVNNTATLLLIPKKKQIVLDAYHQFFIADLTLLFVVFVIFKTQIYKYISPIYNDRKTDYNMSRIHFVQPKQYTYFFEYLIPWISGSSQLAILGLSSYLVFLGNDF